MSSSPIVRRVPSRMSAVRIWAVASNTFREVMRDRIFFILVFYAVVMFGAWRLLPEISGGATDKILADIGPTSASLLGVIVAIFVGTNLINKEIEKRTVFVLVTKPINSAEFIFGKHLGLATVLAILVTGMSAIYIALLSLAHLDFQLVPLLLTAVFLFLELCLITAAALLFGVFTSPILATLLTFSLYLAGHLSEGMVKLAGVTKNPSFQKMTDNLYLVLPDLSRLDLKNDAVYGVVPQADVLWTNAGYALVYTVALLVVTTVVFSRREF
jgi:ABC-type transport system involved in multi-copper enzyme maturation permease subunit